MELRRGITVVSTIVLCGWTAAEAWAQCSPPVFPTECAGVAPLVCPDDVNGPFCNGEGWFLGPGPTDGVMRSGNQLQIDQNCDGDVMDAADAVYDLPPAILQIMQSCPSCDFDYQLSPSQETLYIRVVPGGPGVPGCLLGQSRFYFYALGPEPDLIAFSGVHQGSCMNVPAMPPTFHDEPGNAIRTAVVVGTQPFAGGGQPVFWADLVNRQVNLDAARYGNGLQTPQFSPRGDAAFILAISGGNATEYALIDLCQSPVAAGDSVAFGLFPPEIGNISAEVTGTTGSRNGIISFTPGSPIVIPLEDCLCGACCDAGCTDDVGADACGGTYFGDTTCTPDPCAGPAQEACCFGNGTCSDLAVGDCSAMGGTAQGPGTGCLTTGCPPVTEACCLATSGQCVDMDPADCVANGDTAGGPGSDCSLPMCPPPAGTEACCLPNGSCFNLPPAGPGFTCFTFGGSPQGPGSNCGNGNVNCPMATLSISKAGPASVAEGTEFTCTITYGNGGPDDAFNVEVRETLPAGAVLVSAGNAPGGIAPTIAGGMITWAIGTLPAAAMNQQVTVTVRAGCGITQIVNNNYTINGTPGGMVNGQSVTTQVTPTITDPVTMTIQSVDLNGGLLKEGEILQHTITLTNTASVLREGISVRGTSGGDFSAGYVSVFDAGIDAAGGQFVPNANDTALHWTGDLDPSATINIVFQTRVPDCISTQQSQEILNQGNLMTVRDGCNRQIGQATPTDLFTLQRRVVTRTLASNLTPPKTDSFLIGEAQLAREGSTLQFETVLMTDELTDVHGVTINLTIPADLMVNDPPFVGTPPAGATYNSAARTINLNGTVPAQGMVVIAWEGTIDPASKCRFELRGTGGTMECMPPTMNIDHTLTIFVVPELPAEPYLVTVDSFRGLSIMTPDVDTQGRDLFCKHGEIYSGITQTADGQIWVSGRPSLRFDPVNLECQTFEDDFFMNTLGVAFFTTGIGYDRFSDTLIFRGQGPTAGRVVRYDPAGGVATLILEDPVLNGFGACLVDQEAHVVVIGAGAGAIVRIDPANPQAFQLFNGSNLPEPAGVPVDAFHSMEDIALDVDGNYLLLVSSSWISGPNVLTQRWVAGLDRNSGIFSIVVENLAALHAGINGSDEIPTITVAPDGRFHFAQGVSSQPYHLYRTERACGNQTEYLGHAGVSNDAFVEFVSVEDMVYSDPVVDIGAVPTTTKGDFNADCLIDLADHTGFVDCLAGPDVAPAPTPPTTAQECLDVFDFDGDGDVDMEDEGAFFNLFN